MNSYITMEQGDNQPITLQLTDRLSVRLYRDCRPYCLETGALQKGLVLLLDGEELIEEGVGFGVPVVKYKDKNILFQQSRSISPTIWLWLHNYEGFHVRHRFTKKTRASHLHR